VQLRRPLALLSACAATVLAACEPNQLYLVSHTVVGVNAQVNPDQTSGTLVVGYDRTFATIMPRSVPNNGSQDAMTSVACSSLWVKGITIKRYNESIASGEAADKFSKHLADNATAGAEATSIKDFFGCYKNQTVTTGSGATTTTGATSNGGSQ
jgi:hypothetical protein